MVLKIIERVFEASFIKKSDFPLVIYTNHEERRKSELEQVFSRLNNLV
jgi:hypothetical protein